MIGTDVLLLLFFLTCLAGIVLGALVPDRKTPPVLATLSSVASLFLVWLSVRGIFSSTPLSVSLWVLGPFGKLVIEIDRLSSFFLLITGVVYLAVSIYSEGYLRRYQGIYSLKSFSLFHYLLYASIVLTLTAGDLLLFFMAWEAMSILCYLLVNYEHEHENVTRSGFLMLAMSEAGTLAALVAFMILAAASGDLAFGSLRSVSGRIGLGASWAIFLFSFFGFGLKAGLVPLGSWLPKAHPSAPANVSALLSGVILNLGIYGILRVNADFLPLNHVSKGLIVLGFGALSALIGILYATMRNNIKTMLAHSSIENMGIIVAGLGAGFVFLSSGHGALAGIAFIAAFYHLANHSLYKALLFLAAGAVDAQTGIRDMDSMGGLIRKMPWTSFFFLIGCLSIVALPPFNGFVSEWLTLQTLLQSSILTSKATKIIFALCGAGLALTAGLAVTCFAKAFSMGFLGIARSQEVEKAVEVKRTMTFPLGLLALFCLLLGILPTYVLPVIDRITTPIVRQSAMDDLVPPFFLVTKKGNDRFPEPFIAEFNALGAQVGKEALPGRGLVVMHRGGERNPVIYAMAPSYGLVMLLLLLGLVFFTVRFFTRGRATLRKPAWDGGVRKLLPQMTYTATGFSNPVRVVFGGIFRPIMIRDARETIAEHFLSAVKKDRQDVHVADRFLTTPLLHFGRSVAAALARMHSGRVNSYATYVLLCLLVVFLIRSLA